MAQHDELVRVLDRVRGKRVLVTGGAGQIGMMVTRRLHDLGALPVVYDLRESNPFLADIRDQIVMVQGDLLDLEHLERTLKEHGVDGVIHLAKNPGTSEADPLHTLRLNCIGSGNVLEAARRAGIRRVVYSSSKSVYAEITGPHAPPELKPISEDYPKFDRGDEDYVPFYSTTNKMVEYFGIRFAKKYDMDFVILRFGNTFGPSKLQTYLREGQPYLKGAGTYACVMIESAYKGQPVTFEEGADQRDNLIYTWDLAGGIIAAAVSDRVQFSGNWREIHLDWGRAVSLAEVVQVLERKFPGHQVKIGSGPFTQFEHRKGECVFDLGRARKELGYVPTHSLEDAIDHYVELLELSARQG